jgi:hypothetical protein
MDCYRANLTGNERFEMLQMMADRLERLNVDSKWARRASGTRRGVIKALESINEGRFPPQEIIDSLIQKSMEILSKSAREIPERSELSGYSQKDS